MSAGNWKKILLQWLSYDSRQCNLMSSNGMFTFLTNRLTFTIPGNDATLAICFIPGKKPPIPYAQKNKIQKYIHNIFFSN